MPGTIEVRGNNQYERIVVNMHAQFAPGKPKLTGQDTSEKREKYFMQCLRKLEQHMIQFFYGRAVRVAFPHYIGCGLARGHWPTYRHIIRDFARRIKITHYQGDVVTICCLEEGAASTEARDDAVLARDERTTAENEMTAINETRPRRVNVRRMIRALVAAHAQSHRLIGISVFIKHAERFSITMSMWLMASVPSTFNDNNDKKTTIHRF